MDKEQLLETLYDSAKKILHEQEGTLHPFDVIIAIQATLHFNNAVFGELELSPFEIWELIQAVSIEALNPYDGI
ncbi:TPA: hypothetical protein IXN57_000473 [Enterococcus faecium]|uniref:hypothetical protein n=1 Tax=Enterococcus faecium TaxID=1352 RepID=UPI000330B2B7|nr:hypothetical protein [Enterococcus faecium]EOH45692.1 hypothetical protein SSI_01732 [Enterococcus faecium EnGen0191]HAQ3640982.1 hypothetical protein [Enterococcus faecium]HCU0014016.1 hypothetical protein [Enterococcus faecium]